MKSTIFSSLILIVILGVSSMVNAQQGDIIPTVCSTTTYTLDPGTSIHFYDDGGPGGNCSSDGFANNYANANCETITTICPAACESLEVDFLVLSMYGTSSGWDWIVIYEGVGTSGTVLFDNRAGAPDNPRGTDCNFVNSNDVLNLTTLQDQCLTFRFYATSVVNKEGWDALVTSSPIQGSGAVDVDVTAPTCTSDGFAVITNYDNTATYTFTPAGPSIGSNGEITGATFGQNYSVEQGGGGCASSFQIEEQLEVPDTPTFDITAPTCFADGTAEISNYDAGATYTFTPSGPSVGASGVVTGAAFGQNYTVEVDNGDCDASSTFQIEEQFEVPMPDFFGDTLIGCVPHTVTFIDTSGFQNGICTWDFGDGNTSGLCDTVSHTYMDEGIYDVTLTIESVNGCIGDTTLINYIEVVGNPTADFTADPMITDYTNTEVNFTNESTDATSYIWDFGDFSSPNNDVNPLHEFPNGVDGEYIVTLYAIGDIGCMDTASLIITIINPAIEFTVPNIFTPNGDGINDFFQLINPENIPELEVVILNRWGNVVYESDEVNFKWNGSVQNDGGECSDGTYFYKIIATDINDEKIAKHGFVQLSRDK